MADIVLNCVPGTYHGYNDLSEHGTVDSKNVPGALPHELLFSLTGSYPRLRRIGACYLRRNHIRVSVSMN